MMSPLITKLLSHTQDLWVRILNRYYRYRLVASCHRYGIQLDLRNNVHFYHPVRVWGIGGRIVIKDNVSFACNGGGGWFGPIGIDMRSADAELEIHENCVIMRAVQFVCFQHITIGAGTSIGNGAFFIDSDVHNLTPGEWEKRVKPKPVCLGKSVRIGPEVTILKGVSVGNEAVIGTKSVVQASLPARCVAIGNPARVYLVHPPLISEPLPEASNTTH